MNLGEAGSFGGSAEDCYVWEWGKSQPRLETEATEVRISSVSCSAHEANGL